MANGSWSNWHAHMMANWREMLSPWYKAGVTVTSGCGRIMLLLVCVGSLHGNTLIGRVGYKLLAKHHQTIKSVRYEVLSHHTSNPHVLS